MTHSNQSRKQRILSGRINLAGFGAIVASVALMASADQVHAGTKEKNELSAALTAAGGSYESATPAQIEQAVAALITANTKKAAIYAGEALKSPAALNNGDAGGIAVANGSQTALGATLTGVALQKFVGTAAKTAATSKTPNVAIVPSFTTDLIDSNPDAIAAAEVARASKSAVGAIIGGRAAELPTDVLQTEWANQALGDKKLQAAATEIARYVGDEIAPGRIDEFAVNVSLNSSKLTLKIAPGATAAKPEQAGAITDALLANSTLNPIVLKGAPNYAKSVGAVADIEQITLIGSALARQIGSNAVGITYSKASGLAKTLSAAILAKTIGTDVSIENKSDEIAEVAAYVVGGIIGNSKLTDKVLPKTVLSIIKSAVAGGKSGSKTLKPVATALAATNYIADIAGSVALTIQNSALTDTQKASIQAYLTKNVKKIAGKSTTTQAEVTAALTLGFSDSTEANAKLENGNDLTLANIVDPETDVRNF